MQLKHRVALNGVQLDELDSRIVISGVNEDTGKLSISASNYGSRDGQRVTQDRRETLEVAVRFRLHYRKEQMQAREELLEIVNGWAAAGGWLTVNYKPERRLYVRVAKFAAMGDAWNWTGEYEILFRAYGVPYWQQVNPSSVAFGTATGCAGSLSVAGTAKTVCDVMFLNQGNTTINTITISCTGCGMSFGSLGLAPGETLVIDHTDEGLLRIRIRSTGGVYRSALAARLPASSDDMFVQPGMVACAYTPNWAGTCTISCRGRWV